MLLTELIIENKRQFGEYPFLFYGDKNYTNIEVEQMGKLISNYLTTKGIKQGDRIVVCLPNCPEVIFSYQGILQAGGIIVPVMFLLHPTEIGFILDDSQAKVVITSNELLPNMEKAAERLHKKPLFITVNSVTEPLNYKDLNIIELYSFISGDHVTDDETKALNHEDDVAVILYTSGTTGRPKGVMLTHKNLYSSAYSSYTITKREEEKPGTTLCVLPLAHIYGFTSMNTCFLLGSSVVIFPKFDVVKIFSTIEKFKVRSFSAVPAMIHAMVTNAEAENYDVSSLESVGSGSAPLPVATIQAFKQKFNADILEGYGLSEAAPVVSAHRKGMKIKPGSVGIPIPGVEVRVIDDMGNDAPLGEAGELIVKGDNITPGYYHLKDETVRTIRNGWLHTGDIAKMDEDGYIYIVDRKKDLIIRGGFNIYPRDLEEILTAHKDVSEAAVIGIPDETLGEQVVAYIVKETEATITEADLLLYCQQKLAKYKTPKKVIFIEQLPRNGVGKILKRRLKEIYEGDNHFLK